FTQIENAGGAGVPVTVSLAPGHRNPAPSSTGSMGDVLYEDVQADAGDMVGGQPTRKVRVAVRAIGAAGNAGNGALSFTVPAGQKSFIATSEMSNFDRPMYRPLVFA